MWRIYARGTFVKDKDVTKKETNSLDHVDDILFFTGLKNAVFDGFQNHPKCTIAFVDCRGNHRAPLDGRRLEIMCVCVGFWSLSENKSRIWFEFSFSFTRSI